MQDKLLYKSGLDFDSCDSKDFDLEKNFSLREITDENCRSKLRMEIADDPHTDRLTLVNFM